MSGPRAKKSNRSKRSSPRTRTYRSAALLSPTFLEDLTLLNQGENEEPPELRKSTFRQSNFWDGEGDPLKIEWKSRASLAVDVPRANISDIEWKTGPLEEAVPVPPIPVFSYHRGCLFHSVSTAKAKHHGRTEVLMIKRQRRVNNGHWEREKELIAKLHDMIIPFIVPMYGYDEESSPNYVSILMQKLEADTFNFVDSITDKERYELTSSLFADIKGAIEVLHKNGWYHRDIKLDNIMTKLLPSGKRIFKLGDLGLVTKKGDNVVCGTPIYLTPVLNTNGKVCDYFAAFVTMFSFITKRHPWNERNLNGLKTFLINLAVEQYPTHSFASNPNLPKSKAFQLLKPPHTPHGYSRYALWFLMEIQTDLMEALWPEETSMATGSVGSKRVRDASGLE